MKALLLILLLSAGCASTYTVRRGIAFPKDSTGEATADFYEMIEFHDSCWVEDSTHFEFKIRCKGDRK